MRVKFTGTKDFTFFHGSVRENFAPGQEKDVPEYVGEEMLTTEAVERKFKKDGTLDSEGRVSLFERVVEAENEFPDDYPGSKILNASGKTRREIEALTVEQLLKINGIRAKTAEAIDALRTGEEDKGEN